MGTTCARMVFSICVATALATTQMGILGAQESAEARALIEKADALILEGKAAEARTVLVEVIDRFPTDPAAEKARALITRIETIEILIDYSHQMWGNPVGLGHFLYSEGFGVFWNKAYIPSQRENLARYEMIVLWQDTTDVPYDDLEFSVLHDYVRQGGRILIVTEPGSWKFAFPQKPVTACPLLRFGKRFGLKMKDDGETKEVGIGKVTHYINTGALSSDRLNSSDLTVRREIRTLVDGWLPYPQLRRNSQAVEIPPEILFKQEPILFYYPQHLTKPAEWTTKALPAMMSYYKTVFEAELDRPIRIKGVAKKGEHIQRSLEFDFNLYGSQSMILHQLAIQLCNAWLIPRGNPMTYPYWVDRGLPPVLALDALKKARAVDTYQKDADYVAAMFRDADPDKTSMDVSAPPKHLPSPAFDGKSRFIFETLIKEFGPGFLVRFREILFLYADAGKISGSVATAEIVKLLSLAAGKDLAPFFKSLGTQFIPLPVDFDEPQKLRNALSEKK